VNRILTDRMLEEMAQGIPMLGTVTKPCLIEKETPYIFRITLVQGLNRQIRRMVEHFGYEVVKLERVRIMNVTLKGLPVGDWRELTPQELAGIMKMVEKSSGTEDASGGRRSPKSGEPKTASVDRRPKSGPPTQKNPAANGWWGPRPEKAAGPGTSKRPAKAGPGGPSRSKSSGPGKPAGRPPAKGGSSGRSKGPGPRR
jgi:23S rRNA pseudouridine2604 synthase